MIPLDRQGQVNWDAMKRASGDDWADSVSSQMRAFEFMDVWVEFMMNHGAHEGSCLREACGPLWTRMFQGHEAVERVRGWGAEAEVEAMRQLIMQTFTGFAEMVGAWVMYLSDTSVALGGVEWEAQRWVRELKCQYRAKAQELAPGMLFGPDPIPMHEDKGAGE